MEVLFLFEKQFGVGGVLYGYDVHVDPDGRAEGIAEGFGVPTLDDCDAVVGKIRGPPTGSTGTCRRRNLLHISTETTKEIMCADRKRGEGEGAH